MPALNGTFTLSLDKIVIQGTPGVVLGEINTIAYDPDFETPTATDSPDDDESFLEENATVIIITTVVVAGAGAGALIFMRRRSP